METVKIKKTHSDAIIPEYKTIGSSGMDVSSLNDYDLYPGQVQAISTGLSFEIPEGFEIQVRSRSGLALKNKISVLNSPGTVDSDFRNEVKVILINNNFKGEPFKIKKGDRIAQFVLAKVEKMQFEIVDELNVTERNMGGFGSTGV